MSPRPSSPSWLPFFLVFGAHTARAALPKIDFDRMGSVAVAGAFAGLDLFDNSSALSFDSSTSTLFSRDSDGALSRLAATNQGGSIVASCVLSDTVYIAGSFSSINGTSASNFAWFKPASPALSTSTTDAVDGPIRTLFCDSIENKVWAGGAFHSPSPAVAVFDPKAASWSAPPFGGLTGGAGEVRSITTNSSSSSLFFAGSFVAAFGGNATLNNTNNPNVPFSSGATPFSSSLVPIPLQNASIQGSPSSSQSGFSDIQNVLCPSGADGAGSSWFAADGNTAVVTARAFEFIGASGVRLGNTFLNRSTTMFQVATIPDNAVQTLHYVDPATQQNQTCSDACPLSTDSSVLYQDFTFDTQLNITGVQITLSEWTGAGPGLHLFQLLSSGAFASAVASDNGLSCFAPAASNTSHTGDWQELVVNTNIAATQQRILTANVSVGTSSAQGPSVTWQPYVSASGSYDVRLLVPGCTQLADCAARTSVKVTVFPGGGLSPTITVVDQTNSVDAAPIIYSGPIVPTSPEFTATITMALADSPTDAGSNGQYELVADRVQLVLTSATTSGNGNATSTSTVGAHSAFGFLEWPLSAQANSALSSLPNSSQTAADSLGFDLFTGLGGSSASFASDAVTAVVHHSSGAIVVGGVFSLSSPAAANFAVFKNGALVAPSGGGLNGPVTALAIAGDKVYVGGSFGDTQSGSTNGALRGIAVYDVAQDTWSTLGGGVDSAVASLLLSDNNTKLQVAGNFTTVGASLFATGLAQWDISASAWENAGGFVVGSIALVANSTAGQGDIVAGSVSSALKFGAAGLVLVKNGQDGAPAVTPLGALLDGDAQRSTAQNATPTTRRRAVPKRVGPSAWIQAFRPRNIFSRQTSSSTPSLAAIPDPSPALAPAVFAGAFWTNTTSGTEVVVLGGNFSSGSAQNIAFYDPTSGTLTALNGVQPNGTVRALFTSGTQLFVGGDFTLAAPVNAVGFAVYDLAAGQWESGIQTLEPASGSSGVLVRGLSASSAKSGSVIVAGRFARVGGVACNAVCVIDASTKQWSVLGGGIQGEVAAVDYTGDNQDVLIAAGSLALQSASSATNVVQFSFGNSSWTGVGDASNIPGVVTALTVNDGNQSSIFAAGRTSDGTSSFLEFYNGATWTGVGSTLGTSNISQLTMVPLQDTHDANSIVQQDRMLMVSGTLEDSSFGAASAALFDGANLIPYIMAADASGAQGSISQLFHSLSTFSFTQRHLLATGIVILISIAISAGVVFLLVLIGILWTLIARRDDALAGKLDSGDSDDDGSAHRPSSLLAHINAATRTTILAGTMSPEPLHHTQDEGAEPKDPFSGADASNYLRADTPSEAVAGMLAGEEEPGRSAHARYSFDGAGEGELPLSVGQELEVLDDRDHSWWYARDMRTGHEGVVPAAYLY